MDKDVMELICTIELEPLDYALNEYESAETGSKDYNKNGDIDWKNSLADRNIIGLEPIKSGLWLVDVQTITHAQLKIILPIILEDVELDDFEEQVGPFAGGVALRLAGGLPVHPTCCGDLEAISAWENIVSNDAKDWVMLWIGHPWVYYRKNNNLIEFSEMIEGSQESIGEIIPKIEIIEGELLLQLKKVRVQQAVFESKLRNALNELNISHANQIAQILAGNRIR